MILKTQNGFNEYNLCGEACEAMLVNWATGSDLGAREISPQIEGRGKGDTTSIPQIVDSMRDDYALTMLPQPPSVAVVRKELAAGRPLIALIVRGYVPEWRQIYRLDQWGLHFVVIATKKGQRVLYDPLGFPGRIGDALPVTEATLSLALRALIVFDPLKLNRTRSLTQAQLDRLRQARALLATLPLE